MLMTRHATLTREVSVKDAKLVHTIYTQTPSYFELISIPLPSLAEVERELEAAAQDPRRHIELIFVPAYLDDAVPNDNMTAARCNKIVGYLDYTLNYPEKGDATINLLMIPDNLQSRGYGHYCVHYLEQRLQGKAQRILASIIGNNPKAKRFWSSLGYSFAIDARPVIEWYAKTLNDPYPASLLY